MTKEKILLIGIDGGATKVAAWHVNVEQNGQSFTLGENNTVVNYNDLPEFNTDFVPVPINTQLKEFNDNTIHLTKEEKNQGDVYITACTKAIITLTQITCRSNLLIGLGMPGLKTADKRGIAVLANGPRIPDYAARLEENLKQAGINLAAPIRKLGSDADYCGIGENHTKHGNFADSTNAYYLGGGTGAADAMKLNGHLLPFDEAKLWIAKCWEMQTKENISLEKYASSAGIQFLYGQNSHLSFQTIQDRKLYPRQIADLALTGDQAAINTYSAISDNLALLFYERISTIYCGWQNIFTFVNPKRTISMENHSFKGILLDRIVIGQRLSELMRSRAGQEVLSKPVLENLSRFIGNSTCMDEHARTHYLHGASFRDDRFVLSNLREAAALGAAIDAFQLFFK